MKPLRLLLPPTCTALATGMCVGADVGAQMYPNRPIGFIVPIAPGGSSDFVARIIAQKLSENMDQQIVVDDRSGGGGNIGVPIASKAAPDGDNHGNLEFFRREPHALPEPRLRRGEGFRPGQARSSGRRDSGLTGRAATTIPKRTKNSRLDQLAFVPVALTTAPHLAISSLTNWAAFSGLESVTGSTPARSRTF